MDRLLPPNLRPESIRVTLQRRLQYQTTLKRWSMSEAGADRIAETCTFPFWRRPAKAGPLRKS
jgi:hypothetical protein